MLSSALLLVATAFTGFVNAQYYSTSGPLAIDPNSEPLVLRQSWCNAQLSNCPKICGGYAPENTCDANTLNYTCTCSNGNTPNISNYANTIPSYVCADWIKFCVLAHNNSLDGIAGCRSVVCGDDTSEEAVSTTTSGSSTATTSSGSSTSPASGGSNSGGSPATTTSSTPSSTPNVADIAFKVSSTYPSSLTALGLLAIFGLAL